MHARRAVVRATCAVMTIALAWRATTVDARGFARWSDAGPVVASSVDVGNCDAPAHVVVFWHGMGDYGADRNSMGVLQRAALDALGEENACVKSLTFGSSASLDRWAGYVGRVNDQVDAVCALLAADGAVRHAQGYHGYGFSQGGQFLRAVVERCGSRVRAKTLVTFGAQHMGVESVPGCGDDGDGDAPTIACRWLNRAASSASAMEWARWNVVQAQYFRDTRTHASYQRYLETNIFLPEINNEGQANENVEYRNALISLEKFVCIMFENDDMVFPKESSWFGSHVIGGSVNQTIVPYDQNESIYASLGLDALDADGRLEFILVPDARHLEFTLDWFRGIVKKYVSV